MDNGDKPKTITKRPKRRASISRSRDSVRQNVVKLTARQELFVYEYLIDLNATQAAIRAGYSPKTAQEQSSRLLSNVFVAEAVAEARQKTAAKLEITREKVIEQYARLGFSDTRSFFEDDGQQKSIHELDDDTAAAIQGFEVVMQQIDGPDNPPVPVLKIRWTDRKGASDSLMRAQGWSLPDKVEHTAKGGGLIEHQVRVVMVPPKQTADISTKNIDKDEDG